MFSTLWKAMSWERLLLSRKLIPVVKTEYMTLMLKGHFNFICNSSN